jgi:hypothetical protein
MEMHTTSNRSIQFVLRSGDLFEHIYRDAYNIESIDLSNQTKPNQALQLLELLLKALNS